MDIVAEPETISQIDVAGLWIERDERDEAHALEARALEAPPGVWWTSQRRWSPVCDGRDQAAVAAELVHAAPAGCPRRPRRRR